MSAQSDALDKLLSSTPEMQSAPGIALPLSTMPGDPQQYGQALTQVNRGATLNDVVSQHTAKVGGHSGFAKVLGFFGHVASDVTHPITEGLAAGLQYAGAPLREVQHQYRYIHDVWERHGAIDGLLELLPAAGIATVAAATDIFTAGLASPVSTLAAEAATGALARVAHPDSWQRTENGEAYLDAKGHHVSWGRDLAGLAQHVPGIGGGKGEAHGFLPGVLDAIGDLSLDPLAVAGRVRGEALSIEGAGKGAGVLSKIWGGMKVSNVEQAWNEGKNGIVGYQRFRNAVVDISKIGNEGDIVRRYGQNLGPIADRLAAADTPEKVVDVFRGVADTGEMVSGKLPTRSFTRIPMARLYEAAADPTGNILNRTVSKMARLPNVFDPETLSFSTKSFSLDDAGLKKASEGIYRSLLFGMKPQDAADVVTELYRTSSQELRENIFKTAAMKAIDNFGVKSIEVEGERIPLADVSDELIRKRLFSNIEDTYPSRGGGPPLARGADGRNISGFPNPDGSIENVPVHVGTYDEAGGYDLHGDTGKLSFPDYQKARKELAGIQRMKVFNGGLGQWWYDHYTAGMFKPLALNTLGFAFRVASGEIIPQAMKGDVAALVKSRLAVSLSRGSGEVLDSEIPHVAAAVSKAIRPHLMRAVERVAGTGMSGELAERAELATDIVWDNGGHEVSPPLNAAHNVSAATGDDLRFSNAVDQMHREAMSQEDLGDLGEFTGRDRNETYQWQHNIDRHATDGASQTAAKVLLDELTPKVPVSTPMLENVGEVATGPELYPHPEHGPDVPQTKEALEGELARLEHEEAKLSTRLGTTTDEGRRATIQDMIDQLGEQADKYSQTLGAGPIRTPEAAAPAAEAIEPRTPTRFGRAKAGQYGFESYPKEGGLIGQGKIEKVGKQWNVTYPGEAEVGSTHKTLAEAKQAADDFAAEGHTAEMNRRTANIAGDIDPLKARQAAEKAVTEWLDNAPEELLAHNPRHLNSNIEGRTPHEAWSKLIVQNLMADVTKPGLTDVAATDALHMDVLKDISEGRTTGLDQLFGVDPAHRPSTLVGPAHRMPGLPDSQTLIKRIANYGHQKIFSPWINYVSREPMYHNLVFDHYQGGLKSAVEDGLMAPHEARMVAQQRATYDMSKLVHNLSERTYLSEGMRNWAPFLFAEQQSWRRMGQLLVDDPGAFRRFQLASSALADIGNPQSGEDGASHLVFPGEGFLAEGATKILNKIGIPMAGAVPVAFTGTVQSLGPVFPLADVQMPSGPLVSFGVKALTGMMPELTPLGEKVIGSAGMQSSFMDMLIPNTTLRGMFHTFSGDHNRAFMNAQLYVIQDLARQQQAEDMKASKEGRASKVIVPGEDASAITKQDFLNKVKNQTRIVMGMRAILGSLNPTATSAEIGSAQLRDEVRADIKNLGMAQGMQEFLTKHPDASPYTVFTSESNTQAPLSASSEVGNWLNENLDTLKGYAYGGAWLIPQAKDHFDQGVYNEQLSMNLRQRKAPDQFFKDIQIASSNNQYYAMKDQYDAAVTAAKGDKPKTQALGRKWDALKASFGAQNPIWFEDYQSPQRRIMRDNTIADFRQMIANPGTVPASPQFDGIKELVASYDAFVDASLPGRTDTMARVARASAERRWDTYLDGLTTQRPELIPLITKVFRGATVQAATQAAKADAMTPELQDLLGSLTPEQLAGRTP